MKVYGGCYMARTNRLKIIGADAYYHIISRTVGQEFYLGQSEKEKLLYFIITYSRLYFVKVIGFCIMDNHFHLLIKMENGDKYSDSQIIARLSEFYNRDTWQFKDSVQFYRKKLSDISEYVKAIKNSFSRWYNKTKNRTGYFWGDRFKSVLVQEGVALLNMLIYIDLNPVRAGIVEKPEDYRWSSIGYRVGKGDNNLLCFEGVFSDGIDGVKEYLKTLYVAVGIQSIDQVNIDNQKLQSSLFKKRLKYFSDGVVIGSKSFIKEIYAKFSGIVIKKKEQKAHKTNLGDNICCLRRIRE